MLNIYKLKIPTYIKSMTEKKQVNTESLLRTATVRSAILGLSIKQLSYLLDIPIEFFYEKFPKECKDRKENMDGAVANALIRNALHANNVAAQIFYLKAQANWSDTPIAKKDEYHPPPTFNIIERPDKSTKKHLEDLRNEANNVVKVVENLADQTKKDNNSDNNN